MNSVIVGGGIAGMAAAGVLGDVGTVTVIDRGRRLGGRMGTTRLTEGPWQGHIVDLGAAYLTASDAQFNAVVADWLDRGLVREWTDRLMVAHGSEITGYTSPLMRYAATHGLRSLVEDMADRLPSSVSVIAATDVSRVHRSQSGFAIAAASVATKVRHHFHADRVGLCMPGPQAISLLASGDTAELPRVMSAALSQLYSPIITVVAQWSQRCWPELTGCFVNDHPDLSFIADDGSRRGDGAAVLVIHSSHGLAADHLGDPAATGPRLLASAAQLLGIEQAPEFVHVRRWSLARALPAETDRGPCAIDAVGLGLGGDAFSSNPRIEAAWLSGTHLGHGLVSPVGDSFDALDA